MPPPNLSGLYCLIKHQKTTGWCHGIKIKTIAVSDKFEKAGWGPWTLKAGVHHVQPPIEVLNNMVTFRIHLDDTNESNGCLKLIDRLDIH